MIGGALSLPLALSIDAREWGMGVVIAGMTTYAAASAALAYRRDMSASVNARASAFAHFAGPYVAALAGFVIVVLVVTRITFA